MGRPFYTAVHAAVMDDKIGREKFYDIRTVKMSLITN